MLARNPTSERTRLKQKLADAVPHMSLTIQYYGTRCIPIPVRNKLDRPVTIPVPMFREFATSSELVQSTFPFEGTRAGLSNHAIK